MTIDIVFLQWNNISVVIIIKMKVDRIYDMDFFVNSITLGYKAFSRPQLDVLNY